MGSGLSRHLRDLLGAAVLVAALGRAALGAAPARVVWIDDEPRVRRADAAAIATAPSLPPTGGKVELVGFRGETVAFQVVVVAGEAPVTAAALAVSAPALAGAWLRVSVYAEHYVRVYQRSRNQRMPAESLGWWRGARPPDVEMLGEVPDALLPSAGAATIPAGQSGAFWIDLAIPDDAPPGIYHGTGRVAAGGSLSSFDVAVDVRPPVLPYRAASVMLFYEWSHLDRRYGERAPAVERQLWQVLHAHHIDALAPTDGPDDVARLAAAYDGSLFTAAEDYNGPGPGLAPEVVALGTYGTLRAPGPASLASVEGMLARLPAGRVADVFVYAVDEDCKSPWPAAWEALLAGRPARARVQVGATCGWPPARQTAEIAILPTDAYERGTRAEAEKAGKRAWIYNGRLPGSGTLMLDADPRGLTANGWIAAAADIERWFYWESTFWDDDGPGGHGRVDPFVTAETFHNRDGDSCLGDGLLLYPAAGAVVPSIRLKAIRRGIEDAGLIALAVREHPKEAAAIVARAVPALLDEAPVTERASWEGPGALRFGAARAALRALVTRADPISAAERGDAFRALAASRGRAVYGLKFVKLGYRAVMRHLLLVLPVLLAFLALTVVLVRRRRAS